MSTPRGGRGRGARGGNNPFIRDAGSRGRSDGAHAQNNAERPAQAVYTRGGGQRGGNRGGHNVFTANNRNSTNTRTDTHGRGNNVFTTSSNADSAGGTNSTPFAQDDYSKRLEHIRAARPKLRQRFIKEGRMNPEGQMRLSDSVKLIGICTDMCPEYERVRRIVEEDVKPPECTPETEHLPRKQRIPDESRMVKAYARSAAGMDVELVSEIRSPATCLKTLDYLMQRLDNDEFDFLHSWIWDRTRAIRKDLRTQRIEQRSEIVTLLTCLERSARFLLLSTHQMARSTKEDYSHQQDIEQLNQTLMSLKERYDDNRRVGYPSENEAEFWAYRLILAPLFTTSHLENEIHGLPSDLRHNRRVQTAIEIYRVMKSVILSKSPAFVQARANWKRFWELIKGPNVSYLMACAAEVSFQRVRHVVLDSLWRVYRMGTSTRPHTVETWTTDKLKDVLGFDTDSEAVDLCEAYGFVFNRTSEGRTFLDVTAKGFARTPLALASDLTPQTFSRGIVEKKRYNRSFSAIVQAYSVKEAQAHGLMVESTGEEWEDSNSLFVSEGPATERNIFKQASSTSGSNPPNPFLPQSASATPPAVSSNPFIKPNLVASQPFAGSSPASVQPGVFDASKDTVKFASPVPSGTPFADSTKPNPFIATTPKLQANPSAPAANGTSATGVNFFTQAANATSQQPGATPSSTSSFVFPGSSLGGEKSQTPGSAFSFTPAGSPAPAAPTSEDAEKRKAEEEEMRRKAEAEAEAQQKRAREEAERQAKEAARRQRVEAERRRQQLLLQEEQERMAREARQRQEQKEQERISRIQARETAYNSLTTDIMFDLEQGLMLQFVENTVWNVVDEVVAAAQEAKRRNLWEKKQALADAMYEQRQLGFKRLVMASWIAKVEKKKRARQARDRRQRLKKQRALMGSTDNATPDMQIEASTARINEEVTFHKPQAPASARRAKRTEERRGQKSSQPNGSSNTLSNPGLSAQQSVTAKALTPVSMSHSQTSSLGYSEAYHASTAPIDRTETDWFELRAQGIDPSRHRKRSFGSPSDEEVPEVESKRPRISPPPTEQRPLPTSTTIADCRARLDAIEQRFRNSGGSAKSATDDTTVNGCSSLNGRVSLLLEKARQAISPNVKVSSTNAQHDWGRSIPNFGLSTSSARNSILGKSVGSAATDNRPAYWARKSRFVPQHLYGQGPEAIRAYREQYGLHSPASTRPNSTEPLAVSSPIPTQQSYLPVNGYTQEQYSDEEASGVEVIDVDAEDEIAATTEDEYEGDEESDEEGQEHSHQYHTKVAGAFHTVNEEDNKWADGYTNGEPGQYATEALQDYEAYSEDYEVEEEDEDDDDVDDEEEEDDEEDDEEEETQQPYFTHPGHYIKQTAPAPQARLVQMGGNTEDDAIELSD